MNTVSLRCQISLKWTFSSLLCAVCFWILTGLSPPTAFAFMHSNAASRLERYNHAYQQQQLTICPLSRCALKFAFTPLYRKHSNKINNSNDDNDELDEQVPKAYGNRSISWTNQYRKLVPYEYARTLAMDLGLRSKDEWEEHLADGMIHHGPYMPNRPDEMYAEEWVSWDEFLGIMRTYTETKFIVRNVLQLRSKSEYESFISADTKRAEGLRIPAKPDVVYKNKGWTSWEDFFGVME